MSHYAPANESTPTWESERFAHLRQRMVDEQLRSRGIFDPRVLEAMGRVAREQFVPWELREEAYEDCPLPIGEGQTISQPYTVAYMIEALHLRGDEKVLEIGTGSGYGAAVLGCLAREVHTIERHADLGLAAKERLAALPAPNVHVHVGDGTLGLASEAHFQGIVVTAAGAKLPSALAEQLDLGGRLVIPLGSMLSQTMYRYVKLADGRLESTELGAFAFVPLIGAQGWHFRDL